MNGGSISGQPTSYNVNTATFTLPAPTRAGYSFTGWTGSNGTTAQKNASIAKNSTGNKSYTANWSINSYYLDLNGTLDGASVSNISGYGTADIYINGTLKASAVADFYQQFAYGSKYEIKNIKATAGHTYNGVQSGSLTGTIGAGNVAVSLKFTSNAYTVSFNYNKPTTDGTIVNAGTTSKAVTFNSTYGTLPTPTLNGYAFAGWYTAATNGTKVSDTTKYTTAGNSTLYAHWNLNTYSISYTLNGGSISGQPTSYNVNTATFTLPAPTRAGYTFIGWTGSNGTTAQKSVSIAKNSTGNKSYTANWSLNTYTISYNLNGGNISGQKTSYNVTTDAFTLPVPTRNGYTFTGWTGTGLSSATKTVTVTKGSTGNRSYTANWSANKYTVSYNANGGSGSMSQDTATFGESYTAKSNSFSRTGYTFAGWNESADGKGSDWTSWIGKPWTWNYTKSITLYAQWTKNTYSISYNLNGGNLSGQKTSYDVTTEAFTLPTPTRNGYSFTGWTGTGLSSATKSVTVAKGSTGNKSYTANWSANGYTISFNYNKPTTDGAIGNAGTTSKAVIFDSAYGTLPAPTLNGYSFAGWYTAATNGTKISDAMKYTTAGNSTLYVHWNLNTYSISYTLNGGSISGQPTSYNVNTATFTLPAPTRAGYTFIGWTGSNGTTAQKSVPIAKNSTGNKSYTANWSLNTYTISYNLNRGNISGQKTSYDVTTEAFTLPVPTRNGYAFTGWTGTGLSSATKTVTVAKGSTGNRSYTANWSANGYTISFNYNKPTTDGAIGNAGTTSKAVIFDSAYGTLPAPTLNGYSFAGWYTAATNGTKVSDTTKYTTAGNSTLYAYWIPNTYTVEYNGNGSTSGSMTDSSCSYDTAFSLSKNTFSRKGYLFCGWNTQSDGKGTSYKDRESVKNLSTENGKAVMLYAQWTPIKYTVKYDANGGIGTAPTDTTHTFNENGTVYPENALAKNTFTRKGYKFSGWNASRVKDGKIEWYYDNWNWYEEGKNPKSASKYVWTDGGDTHNASDVDGDVLTMHAQWKANTLTINYHNDNGTTWRQYPDDSTIDVSNKDIVQSETVTYDEKYNHYEFGLIDAGRLMKAGYHSNNGWKINSMDSKTIVPDTNSSMNSYENSGKGVADFLGVSTGFEKGDVTVDLYPDIAINTGTVHYYPNSNEAVAKAGYDRYITNGEFAGSLATTTSFDYKTTGGSGANTLTDVYTLFERKGYHQSAAQNWHYGSPDSDVYFHCDEEDLSPYAKDATDVHLKLYANWLSNDYTVKFDGNGSTSGNMADVTCKYDESFNLTENKFVRNDYEFIGWNTEKDGSGQDYKDKESVKNLTDEDNGTVTLYAQWKLNAYTLTVSHTISGNMGNRDKDFSFTMSLSNNNKDAVIPENIEAIFMDDIGNKSKKSFAVVDGRVTFTLSHKESIIFKDIPNGTSYTILEDNENEYNVTNESASGTITKDTEVSFVSTKNGTVPTSSDTPNLYPIIMISFAGIMYVILSQRKKKIKQKR